FAVLVVVVALSAPWLRSSSSASAETGSRSEFAGAADPTHAFVKVVGRVRPSVVEISTQDGLGSGVVYDGEGNIVTNAHVVSGASRVHVTLACGRTCLGAVVAVYDPDDLAVVHVSASGLRPATFGNSSAVR